MQLNVRAFALTCAILWGLGVLLLTWWIILLDGATGDKGGLLGSVYRGYSVSPLGSLIGLVWGFADGLIGGTIFAWLYNRLVAPAASPQAHWPPTHPR